MYRERLDRARYGALGTTPLGAITLQVHATLRCGYKLYHSLDLSSIAREIQAADMATHRKSNASRTVNQYLTVDQPIDRMLITNVADGTTPHTCSDAFHQRKQVTHIKLPIPFLDHSLISPEQVQKGILTPTLKVFVNVSRTYKTSASVKVPLTTMVATILLRPSAKAPAAR